MRIKQNLHNEDLHNEFNRLHILIRYSDRSFFLQVTFHGFPTYRPTLIREKKGTVQRREQQQPAQPVLRVRLLHLEGRNRVRSATCLKLRIVNRSSPSRIQWP